MDSVTHTRCWAQAAGRRAGSNRRRSTCSVAPATISSAIASPLAGALRMPQTLCPVATKALATPSTGPSSGRPSCVTGRKQACVASDRGVRKSWCEDAGHRSQRILRPRVGHHIGRVVRQRLLAGQTADIGRAVGAREHLRRVRRTVGGRQLDEQRVGRDPAAALVHHAVALEPVHRRQRQPLAGRHGPRPHGDDDGIGLEHHAVDLDAQCRGARRRRGRRRSRMPSRSCAPSSIGRLQHRLGEPRRVHLRRGRLCAELALHQRALAEPGEARTRHDRRQLPRPAPASTLQVSSRR